MKRNEIIAILLMIGFMILTVGSLCAQDGHVPYWWRGKNFNGRITKIEKSRIEVTNNKNEKKEFELNSMTKIFLRGAEKLDAGMFVKIVYKETKQVNIARAIREMRSPQ
ncbi:MAG: hypothetical protein K8T10_02580 [Candidatus Eremiobacteraeota bacterium]|nr:hypothetical protein [Candidatus Eremiobacteraeota bacterium]